jgi:DHA3 family tetracycline resistance protein-like MFS transporter
MHHSYEGLDRPGGFSRIRLLAPLRHRDFRLLWSGTCVSLVGDGVFRLAMAWQVYTLSNAPMALSVVGIAMTVPMIASLLLGGVVSDRLDRRKVILASDLARGASVALMAALALAGELHVWEIVALAVVYGAGTGFFAPAFDAIVPEILPAEELAQANSLDQFVRPLALRLAGPALGGVLIEALGSGSAFALDAASFFASAAAVAALRARPRARREARGALGADLRGGFDYVRRQVWLWGTFAAAAIAYLAFMGPTEVLLPFVVKNTLGGSAAAFGLVLAAGGLGSVACALVIGQRGLPRREITFIYVVWSLATLAVAGYGLAASIWQLMVACVVFNALETAGTIVWATLKQRRVPASLLGRVSSLDWLISIGLLPLSLAMTGPVSAAIGVRATLVAAGLVGAIVTLAALYLPGMRDVERSSDQGSAVEPPSLAVIRNP